MPKFLHKCKDHWPALVILSQAKRVPEEEVKSPDKTIGFQNWLFILHKQSDLCEDSQEGNQLSRLHNRARWDTGGTLSKVKWPLVWGHQGRILAVKFDLHAADVLNHKTCYCNFAPVKNLPLKHGGKLKVCNQRQIACLKVWMKLSRY